MKITDEAKELLNEALVSNDCDCLVVLLEESCCGTSFDFGLGKLEEGDEPVFVNDIPVMMNAEAQEKVKNVTLAAEEGELVIHDEGCSCCC